MSTDLKPPLPKYAHLVEELRRQIGTEYQPGDRLPTLAELRVRFGASNSTMERVYTLLEQEGLIVREQGRGTFVTEPKRLERTGLIGFIGHDSYLHSRPFYVSDIAEGIRKTMTSAERQILLLDSDSAQGLSKIEGIIVCSPRLSEAVLQYIPPEMPCVSLLASLEGTASVITDDQGGARQAVQFLIDQGHQRIACLMEKGALLANLRLEGYREALLEDGIEPQPQWEYVLEKKHLSEDYRTLGHDAMREWLRDGWSETGCTAIFAQNDQVGIGVMYALQEAGYRIPEDVSVIGFDGTDVCDYSQPRLCSVSAPLHDIGVLGSELLLQQIESGKSDATVTMLPTQLRAGDSVGVPLAVAAVTG